MSLRVWGISDGSAGMKAQIDALASACDYTIEHKTVAIDAPWSWLPVRFYVWGWSRLLLDEELMHDLPDLVISCGRRGAMAALGLKHVARDVGKPVKFLCLQDPRISASYFDMVIALKHDKIEGSNVIKTEHALHRITPDLLAEARALWQSVFSTYNRDYVAVLMGGGTNRYRFTKAHMQRVMFELERVIKATKNSLLITPSRRTGDDNIQLLKMLASERVYVFTEGANPYLGMLALADSIIVTNDSVNMMTDAYATGKPVYILPLPGHAGTKPALFAENLVAEGAARWLTLPLAQWEYEVKNEMPDIARMVHLKFG